SRSEGKSDRRVRSACTRTGHAGVVTRRRKRRLGKRRPRGRSLPRRRGVARMLRKFVIGALTGGLLMAAVAGSALAAGGDLDPGLGVGGGVLTDFSSSTDIADAVAVQADGKYVVVGLTYTNNDYSGEDFALARYNADGTLDATFGVRGRVTTDF